MNLKTLNEFFIRTSRDNDISRMPISPSRANRPIVPLERWSTVDGVYVKTYHYQSLTHRNEMIKCLLKYEEDINHCASMHVDEKSLTLSLKTKTIDSITELDKEYAKYADQVFKDVILYTINHHENTTDEW